MFDLVERTYDWMINRLFDFDCDYYVLAFRTLQYILTNCETITTTSTMEYGSPFRPKGGPNSVSTVLRLNGSYQEQQKDKQLVG